MITGGLGGIGFTLAEHLAKTAQAKLILTMRSKLPAKNEWSQWLSNHNEQDNISRKIRKVQTLETLGAEVLIITADVVNLAQMQATIAQSLERFEHIHGARLSRYKFLPNIAYSILGIFIANLVTY